MRFTLALPRWQGDAGLRIQRWRAQHDPRAAQVAPHLPLLYGIDCDPLAYQGHVAKVAARTAPQPFALSVAVPWCTGNGAAAVLLLVEQGLAPLVHLHRALYGGPLAPWRALDQPFVPHVPLAHLEDALMAQALADRWNAQAGHEAPLAGVVDSLSIGTLTDGRWSTERCLALSGSEAGSQVPVCRPAGAAQPWEAAA